MSEREIVIDCACTTEKHCPSISLTDMGSVSDVECWLILTDDETILSQDIYLDRERIERLRDYLNSILAKS